MRRNERRELLRERRRPDDRRAEPRRLEPRRAKAEETCAASSAMWAAAAMEAAAVVRVADRGPLEAWLLVLLLTVLARLEMLPVGSGESIMVEVDSLLSRSGL